MYIYKDIHLHSKQANKALKMQSLKDAASSVGDKVESMMADSQAQEKPGAAAGGSYSFSATTGQEGQSTGSHQMSALPGHGKGEPAGHVVEGTATAHPIGKATGAPGRNTTAQNTHVGGAGGQTYGTGGGYNG